MGAGRRAVRGGAGRPQRTARGPLGSAAGVQPVVGVPARHGGEEMPEPWAALSNHVPDLHLWRGGPLGGARRLRSGTRSCPSSSSPSSPRRILRDGLTQQGVLLGHRLRRPVRVEPAGIRKHPHPRAADPPLLRTDPRSLLAEGGPVRGDADDRERRGRSRCAFSARSRPPSSSSAALSSSARAVARATRFVIPSPYASSSSCSAGRSCRGVNPARCSTGQKRLPGRAKWWPVAAGHQARLMPQKSDGQAARDHVGDREAGPGRGEPCPRPRAAGVSRRSGGGPV